MPVSFSFGRCWSDQCHQLTSLNDNHQTSEVLTGPHFRQEARTAIRFGFCSLRTTTPGECAAAATRDGKVKKRKKWGKLVTAYEGAVERSSIVVSFPY